MSVFLSFTVLGIVTGAIYGILAIGQVVTYKTTGVFNVAQGAVGMVAAFSYWQLWQNWHWPFLLAIVVIVFIEAPLLAIAVEFVLMRRMHGATVERSLMVTLGLLVILLGVAAIFWSSPDVIRSVPAFFTSADGTVGSVHIFGANGVSITYQQLMIVGVAIVVAVGLGVFLRRMRLGVAMRAVVDDPELVAMSGAKPYRIAQMGWSLGFMLAALAGILIAPLVGQTGLTIDQLTLLALNGFAAAVVGRLRSLPMTFVGAITLGLLTQYAIGYLPGHINAGLASVLAEVTPVLFLFVVLIIIPAARLAPAGRLSVRPAPKVVTARQSATGAVVLVLAMAVISVLVGSTALATLSQGLALGVVGLSLVLLVGYAGQVSLCQLTFMGIGAFTMGKVLGGDSWWGLLLGVAVSGLVGALVALPALRLRGLYLALATFAFGEVMYSAFFNNSSVISEGTSINVGRLPLPLIHGVSGRVELLEVAVVAALCALLVGAVRRSSFGRRLVAMSDSPAAFATVGLSSVRTKVIVFSLSAAMAGLGGALYAGQQGGIGATDVHFIGSLTLLLFVAIWGIRTVAGGLLGGLTAAALPVLQTHVPTALADLIGLAAGIGIVLLARHPEGILGMEWLTHRVHVPFAKRYEENSRVPSCGVDVASSMVSNASVEPSAAPALEVRGVSLDFGGIAALCEISLRAKAGEVTGLIGPNGAGKTTLFNVISGLQRPDCGSVHLAGVEVTRHGTHRRARLGLGRTFQRLELFSTLSATDNVRVGLESFGPADASAAEGPLQRVGALEATASPVSSLPTGSARLVDLARALAIDPKVLLLDEPCSGLDERETGALGVLLTSLAAEGRAVVLVEHDTDLVLRICSTVHVLNFGQVIASGPPEVIRHDPLVREAYLGQPLEGGVA